MKADRDSRIIDRITKQMDIRGISSLSDEQLLALIIKEGSPSKDVLSFSQAILERFTVEELATLPVQHITSKISGLSEDSLISLTACCQLVGRINEEKASSKALRNAEDVYELMRSEMMHFRKEYFRAIAVNSQLELIGIDDVSIGSIDSASAHPREVFRGAIALGASGIFLVHNHPSDNPFPSLSDRTATQKIRESGNIIGIQLIDHVIITSKGYYSFNTGQAVFAQKPAENVNKYFQKEKNVL